MRSNDDADLAKNDAVRIEQAYCGDLGPEDAAFLASFTDQQRKAVLRKVDWRLVPMLLVLYLISFIDRANIGRDLPTYMRRFKKQSLIMFRQAMRRLKVLCPTCT